MVGEMAMDEATALDQALDQRRKLLRLRWTEIARQAGMTTQNLSRIRNGQVALTSFAATGIDQAMDWPAGTTWAIYHGTDLPAVEEPDLRDDHEREIWALDTVPQELRRELIEGHREILEAQRRSRGHNQSA